MSLHWFAPSSPPPPQSASPQHASGWDKATGTCAVSTSGAIQLKVDEKRKLRDSVIAALSDIKSMTQGLFLQHTTAGACPMAWRMHGLVYRYWISPDRSMFPSDLQRRLWNAMLSKLLIVETDMRVSYTMILFIPTQPNPYKSNAHFHMQYEMPNNPCHFHS